MQLETGKQIHLN